MKAFISLVLMITSAVGMLAMLGLLENAQGGLLWPAVGAFLSLLFLGFSLAELGVYSMRPARHARPPYRPARAGRHQ